MAAPAKAVFTISVLLGSAREGRHGIKVANVVVNRLKANGHTVHLIDPVEYPAIQTFTERYRFHKNPPADLVKIHDMLEQSDGFVAVTPEYNYMYSPIMKNYMDTYFNEYKYKPCGFVGYSISPFGAVRALEHLRATTNVLGMTPVPTMTILPGVQDLFTEDGTELKNEFNKKSLDNMVREFEWYCTALANHRKADPSVLPKP